MRRNPSSDDTALFVRSALFHLATMSLRVRKDHAERLVARLQEEIEMLHRAEAEGVAVPKYDIPARDH